MKSDKKYERATRELSIKLSSMTNADRERFRRLLQEIERDAAILYRRFELKGFPNLAA